MRDFVFQKDKSDMREIYKNNFFDERLEIFLGENLESKRFEKNIGKLGRDNFKFQRKLKIDFRLSKD